MDDEMQALLSRADRALGRLDGSIQTLPNPDLFVFMYVRKEAVLSSQIEGTQASINDILEVEAEVFNPRHPRDVDEVLNYIEAMNYGLSRLEKLPLSIRLIREIHEHLMRNVRGAEMRPGELRTSQNWIGPQGSTLNNATFVPPPPNVVPEALGDLEQFLHDETPMPALVKVGLAHAQFETIHPFLDGNGRIGRLLVSFFLCEKEILLRPALYISHYFKRHRDRYYELLQATRDGGDWETWLKFFLDGIAEVSLEATETARKIVDLREEHRNLITHEFGRVAGNGINVLERLYRLPLIQVKDVVNLLGVSFPSANSLIQKFVDHGLLAEVTGQARHRRFRYGQYISLFSEE
jgi:Fic family protein